MTHWSTVSIRQGHVRGNLLYHNVEKVIEIGCDDNGAVETIWATYKLNRDMSLATHTLADVLLQAARNVSGGWHVTSLQRDEITLEFRSGREVSIKELEATSERAIAKLLSLHWEQKMKKILRQI